MESHKAPSWQTPDSSGTSIAPSRGCSQMLLDFGTMHDRLLGTWWV
eukprot:CAMPEP_0174315564 /NCGR_PEP_ID=MMETSP0810-20121108/6365_1 /TAXON_ID=73025 ORGANISM="Eutreptiella gymnastica-like, Strain CCMP1594" /NCGR_SAMPLE_ID=MMETSP0810 /ASSEMBLY_ACC=CAM_ASM_000659 /LENGTH=45 /DNA_ID= /DNA_START= /DNA_END= /DNA_ORIENTATION=